MREALNSNPMVQLAVVGVLIVAAGFFALTTMGGGSKPTSSASAPAGGATTSPTSSPSSAPASSGATSAPTPAAPTAPAAGASSAAAPGGPLPVVPAPRLPAKVMAAYDANRVVVLLVVRPSGVDDRMFAAAAAPVSSLPNVAAFVVPVKQVSRYASITQGVSLDRVPALIVMRQRNLSGGTPGAEVSYGFQSPQAIVQAVRDGSYSGPPATYQP